MTRHILSTAALAAFLASGHPFTIPAAERAAERRTPVAVRQAARAPAAVVAIDDRLLAVDLLRRDPSALHLALQLEGPAVPIRLWTGAKNAWGSSVALAEPQAGLPGFLQAQVAVLPGSDRLWIGIERDGRRPAVGALRLDDIA